jgi:hypothetical protein
LSLITNITQDNVIFIELGPCDRHRYCPTVLLERQKQNLLGCNCQTSRHRFSIFTRFACLNLYYVYGIRPIKYYVEVVITH